MNFRTWLRAEWDRVAAAVLITLGAVLVIVGYIGAKGTPYAVDALAYIASGGVGGIFCLGLGVGLLLSGDLHDEWRKLDRLEAAIRGNPLSDAEDVLDIARRERRPEPAPVEDAGRRSQPGDGGVGASVTAAGAASCTGGAGPLHGARAVALDWWEGRPAAGAVAVFLALVPLGVMGGGWSVAKHTAAFDTGVKGAALAGFGLVLALGLVALHTLWLRSRVISRAGILLDEHAQEVRSSAADLRSVVSPVEPAAGVGDVDSHVLVVAGLKRFHRAGCAALAGLEAVAVAREEAVSSRGPCGLCGS